MEGSVPISIDFEANKNVLLLAFGGLHNQLGMPSFEFSQITSEIKTINKIYLRDYSRLWYHRGLPNVGNNIAAIAACLQQYTTHSSTKKTIVLGNSGGGYAALLFGHILQADEIHAFSPKTSINPIQRIMNYDIQKLRKFVSFFELYRYGERKYFDLKPVFFAAYPQKRNVHIYYARQNRIDAFHALRMKSIPGIHLHPFQYNKHNLIKILKQNGELKAIIEQAISL